MRLATSGLSTSNLLRAQRLSEVVSEQRQSRDPRTANLRTRLILQMPVPKVKHDLFG
jgi:hypothetical protein